MNVSLDSRDQGFVTSQMNKLRLLLQSCPDRAIGSYFPMWFLLRTRIFYVSTHLLLDGLNRHLLLDAPLGNPSHLLHPFVFVL